jgi:RNA-binding protein YlmH
MDEIYQHYPPTERAFIDKGLDWIRQVDNRQAFHCTYFLNPREREILSSLIKSGASELLSFASLVSAEYQKMILAPSYYRLDPIDFDLALIEIDFPSKFGQISHRQILGSLLGETGLERREIGDILVNAEKAQFYTSRSMVGHFVTEIRKIGAFAVKLEEVSLNRAIKVDDEAINSMILSSSLRVDKVIAASLNISRNLASNMVQSGQVKVNYRDILKPELLLCEGDMLSVRGYGRLKILHLRGFTKKDKMKIEISSILNRKGK